MSINDYTPGELQVMDARTISELKARAEKAERLWHVEHEGRLVALRERDEALAALQAIARLPLTRSVEMHAAQIARAALEGEKR